MQSDEGFEKGRSNSLSRKVKNTRRLFLKFLFNSAVTAAIGFIVYPVICSMLVRLETYLVLLSRLAQ